MSRTHNELTVVEVTVEPIDANGNNFAPTTARYRIDDCRSTKSLVGWTSLTPSSSMTITVPSATNAIIDNMQNTPEVKVITVNTDVGLSTEQYSQYTYRVKNLQFAQAS